MVSMILPMDADTIRMTAGATDGPSTRSTMIETVLVMPGAAGELPGGGPHGAGPVTHPATTVPPYRVPAPTVWSAPGDEDEDEDDGGPEWVRKAEETPVR